MHRLILTLIGQLKLFQLTEEVSNVKHNTVWFGHCLPCSLLYFSPLHHLYFLTLSQDSMLTVASLFLATSDSTNMALILSTSRAW